MPACPSSSPSPWAEFSQGSSECPRPERRPDHSEQWFKSEETITDLKRKTSFVKRYMGVCITDL